MQYTVRNAFYSSVYVTLFQISSDQSLKDCITLHNSGLTSIAYRMLVSVPNLFVLNPGEGVLSPYQKATIAVILDSLPPVNANDPILAKIAVEFLACDDDDYYILGPKAYWKKNGDRAIRKKLVAERGAPKGLCFVIHPCNPCNNEIAFFED
jgi:hypothetical protein